MARKVRVSASIEQEHAEWLDEQPEANSVVIRRLIREAKGDE